MKTLILALIMLAIVLLAYVAIDMVIFHPFLLLLGIGISLIVN
jgi:hypothetical protein